MTDELYVSMSLYDENTTTTIGRIPDDSEYELDIFIPREHWFAHPDRMPKTKRTRFMFGGCDSEFYDWYRVYGEVILFSTFWLYEYARLVDISEIIHKSFEFDKFGICLNNAPKRHRQLLMKELDDLNILSNSYWTWITPINRSDENSNWCLHDTVWKNETIKKTIDSQNYITSQNCTQYEYNIPIEYKKGFLDIVNETGLETPFLTEKTYRALLFGKPFIVNGAKGTHKAIESLGFKLYDELFDYSFDSIQDDETRIKEISKQIENIQYRDLDEMWELVYNKVKFNQQRCFEIIENEIGVPKIESFQSNLWDFVVKGAKEKIPYLRENISI